MAKSRLDKFKKLLRAATAGEFRKLPWRWSWYCESPQLEGSEPEAPVFQTYLCEACRERDDQGRVQITDGACLSPQKVEQDFIAEVVNAAPEFVEILDTLKQLSEFNIGGEYERQCTMRLRGLWEKFDNA